MGTDQPMLVTLDSSQQMFFRSTKRLSLRGHDKAAYRHVSIKGDMNHLEMEQMRKLVRQTDWKEKG